jgi:iron complex transport system ATP-binding protein
MDLEGNESVIDLRGIHLVRSGREILRGIDWRVSPGEQWAIVGANGSGKTTLLRIATGYLWPTRGSAGVLGRWFGQVDLRERYRAGRSSLGSRTWGMAFSSARSTTQTLR